MQARCYQFNKFAKNKKNQPAQMQMVTWFVKE